MPSAEDAARRVLKLFKEKKARPSHVLRDGDFFIWFAGDGLTLDDFKSGCDHAVEQGWIERPDHGTYKLTSEGFSEL
jgi:hypothetical protein